MSEKLDRFVELLRKIFELDKSELDFGIYRIMNIRKAQIEEFLSKRLPEQVRAILEPIANNPYEIRKKMAELKTLAARFNADVEQNSEYKALQEQLSSSADISALETDVYSYLYNFFNRYYDEGDFISKRRYKEGVYAIPYEGEEVKLYWANQDQYYIKTTENFRDYSFLSDDITVHFMLVDATTEQNNNKKNSKKRTFMLFTENEEQPGIKTFEIKDNEFIVRFIYDLSEEKQTTWTENNLTAIKNFIVHGHDTLMPLITPSIPFGKETISPIHKHLLGYVAKNTFDYFIHKDLGGFLNRELDFFIKNEIIHLDDLDTEKEEHITRYITKVRAIKKVGKIIIDFLAQIENFQKRLWLKKKFIVRTDWCITLDRVPEEFYEEIRNNKAQIQEWINLYSIDSEISGNGKLNLTEKWSNPPSVEFLKANKNLVIDTKHFSLMFKDILISGIDNLDETVDGILIHSENFQALNMLQERYKEKVQSIYIDPPYNADATRIMYKNGYLNSSWCSLMMDRLSLSRRLLDKYGILCVTIDDYEFNNLKPILDVVFNNNYLATTVIRNNPSGRSTVTGFSINHEYGLYYSNSVDNIKIGRLSHTDEQASRYNEVDINGNKFEWENLRKSSAGSFRTDRPKQYYPIFVNESDLSIRIPSIIWNDKTKDYKVQDNLKKNEIIAYPIDSSGQMRVWRWGLERITKSFSEVKVILKDGQYEFYTPKYLKADGILPRTWWDKPDYSARDSGTRIISNLFGGGKPFDFAKAVAAVEDTINIMCVDENSIIIDYFAGSGTTGHAVIELNRQDSGNRKYILVEMGDYFNSVTKPRMQKVVYAKEWKEGKPLSRDTGISHLIKYFQLESYEDTLTNIEFSDRPDGKSLAFGDEYLINYMLNTETKGSLLNIEKFKEPFDYRLRITEKNETKETRIDLCETFNYLLGLRVIRQNAIQFYKAVNNNNKDYEGSVDLKSDKNGDYGFKQIEGYLNDDRRILVIWRNITDNLIESNAALDAYFQKSRADFTDREYTFIYVNGDNNLDNIRAENETWKVKTIENEFFSRMFDE
jgi:adenine-specific DNA-methyltransferase